MTESKIDQSFHSKLFDREGDFIPISDFIGDIRHAQRYGPWKIPLRIIDRIQLLFLAFLVKMSWFKELLYIHYSSPVSPSFSLLLAYLKKNHFFDDYKKRFLPTGGGFGFSFWKSYSKDRFIDSQGIHHDKATALSVAIGELVERTVSGVLDNNPVVISTPHKILRDHCVFYPPLFHRFLDIQINAYPRLLVNQDKEIAWVKGKNLVTGKPAFIPKSVSSWFIGKQEFQEILMHTTTSGSAGFFNEETATLHGLLEVIERDAFFVHWLTKTSPPRIRKESLPLDLRSIIDDIEKKGIELFILNTTAIPVPSIAVIALNKEAKASIIALSASCKTNFYEAVHDGLREMRMGTSAFYNTSDLSSLIEESSFEPFLSALGKKDRMLYWRTTQQLLKIDWLFSGVEVEYSALESKSVAPSSDSVKHKLQKTIEVLEKEGKDYYPIVYFPRNPLLKKIGYCVAQVFIPKAFPLFMVERYGTFDSERLDEFAKKIGKQQWTLNEEPHMFC